MTNSASASSLALNKAATKHNKIRMGKGERLFNYVNLGIMLTMCVVFLYPILYVLARSVMTDADRVAHPLTLIPSAIDWAGYKMVLTGNSNLINAYVITIARTVIGTLINLLFTSFMAYVLSRKSFSMKKAVNMLLAFTMWFDGGLIPTYLLYQSMGLGNNFWVYILPVAISPWNCFILRNFFAEIPDSLEESARIDGASEPTILFRIILPLSTASLATVGLFYAVMHWNSWYDAMLYMTNNKMWSLQYILRQIVNSANMVDLVNADASATPPTEMVRMACTVVATVPILCVYPFLQKYFVKGMLVGAVKG